MLGISNMHTCDFSSIARPFYPLDISRSSYAWCKFKSGPLRSKIINHTISFKRIGVGRQCLYFVYKFLWLEELTENDIWATTHDVDNDDLGLSLAFKQN